MIKLTAAICPREGWSFEEWNTHYKERHASLSASVTNFTRHARRYLQNCAERSAVIPPFPDCDRSRAGITELWFDDVEAIKTAYSEPDYFTYLRTDELRFCTFDNIIAGIAREEEIMPFADQGVGDKLYAKRPRHKLFVFLTRKDGMDRAQFQAAWRDVRGPALAASDSFRTYVRRYIQSHMLDEDIGLPGDVVHDVIDEFTFDSAADSAAFWGEVLNAPAFAERDAAHVDTASTWTVFANEHEVFGPLPVA
jgi:hypothetical protein